MEESYETFEEELGPPRADPPPQKPVRKICKPEMYAARKIREETATVPQQPRAEPTAITKEPGIPRTISLHKALSIQNLTPIETPWENVTLNRCLFVAITILVLTSGFQRLNETLRGHGTVEDVEEVGLRVRRSGILRHRGQPPEPETSLFEVLFWWLPDLDDEEDEDEEDDDEPVKSGRPMKKTRASSGFRNKPLPDKNLMKQRDGRLMKRRAKKARAAENKDKKQRENKKEDRIEGEEDGNDTDEEVPKRSKRLEKK